MARQSTVGMGFPCIAAANSFLPNRHSGQWGLGSPVLVLLRHRHHYAASWCAGKRTSEAE